MAAVYPARHARVNTPTPPPPASLPTPQPLPNWLKPYAATFRRLTKKTGYVFAELKWFLENWHVKRWKVYSIIDKLCSYGWFVRQRIPGSHDRIYWPVPIPERFPNPFKKADSAPSAPQPAPSRPWSQETPEKQALVRELVARGVKLGVARQAEKDLGADHELALAQLDGNVAEWNAFCAKSKVNYPAKALVKAIRENWQPPAAQAAPPAPVLVAADPAPAPSAIALMKGPASLTRALMKHAPNLLSGGMPPPTSPTDDRRPKT